MNRKINKPRLMGGASSKKLNFKTLLSQPLPEDIHSVLKDDYFPSPDYVILQRNDVTEESCKLICYIRSILVRRPDDSDTEKLAEWVERIKVARLLTLDCLENKEQDMSILEKMLNLINPEYNHRWELELRSHLELDEVRKLKGYKICFDNSRYFFCKGNVSAKGDKEVYMGEHKSIKELAKGFQEWRGHKKHNVKDKIKVCISADDMFFIGAYDANCRSLVLSPYYEKLKDAKKNLTDNIDKYVELVRQSGSTIPLRTRVEIPQKQAGAESLEATIINTFGIKEIKFGITTEENVKKYALSYVYDALNDISRATGIHKSTVGLYGLSLGIGARTFGAAGNGSYLRNHHIIHLPSTFSMGDIAFHWMLALDSSLANLYCLKQTTSLAQACVAQKSTIADNEAQKPLIKAYKSLVRYLMKDAPNSFYNRNVVYSRGRRTELYRPCILLARAFEAYLLTTGIKNDYLVSFIKRDEFLKKDVGYAYTKDKMDAYPYPKEDELPAIVELFDELFSAMR